MKNKLIRATQNVIEKLKGFLTGSPHAKQSTHSLPPASKTSAVKKKAKTFKIMNPKRLIIAGAALIVVVALAVVLFTPPAGDKVASADAAVQGAVQSVKPSNNYAINIDEQYSESPSQEIEDAEAVNAADDGGQTDAEPKDKDAKTNTSSSDSLVPGGHSKKVIQLQQRLMDLDYMDPDEPTDFYGPQTQYALQLFQRKHSLQIDGIAGADTLKLLNAKDAKRYTVSTGESGTDVEELQARLIDLGYEKGGATGYFGTDTETAVKLFQKQNKLTVDGNVGSGTREALYAEDAKEYNTPSKPAPKSTPKPSIKKEKSTTKIPNDKSVKSLIAFAKQQLGEPYVRGGKGPNKFDCSGFVYYCLKNIGVNLHYMTSSAWRSASYGKVTSFRDLKAGDIIVYRGHVGIYLGGAKMIDASSSQGKVRIASNIFSSSYWKKYFICGRRVL